MQINKNFSLKNFTTMAMGGPARFFVVVENEADLLNAVKFAKQKGLPWYGVGEG
jgi:UDP-N-acetylenolpyruvoylglucosamine reductase